MMLFVSAPAQDRTASATCKHQQETRTFVQASAVKNSAKSASFYNPSSRSPCHISIVDFAVVLLAAVESDVQLQARNVSLVQLSGSDLALLSSGAFLGNKCPASGVHRFRHSETAEELVLIE